MLNSQYTYLQDQNGNPILGRTQHNSTQVVLVVDLLSDFRVLAITREQAEELTARGKMLT